MSKKKSKADSIPLNLNLPPLNMRNRAPLVPQHQSPSQAQVTINNNNINKNNNSNAQPTPIQIESDTKNSTNTHVTTTTATLHATNVFSSQFNTVAPFSNIKRGYGPVTNNQYLQISTALTILPTRKPMPNILELPKYYITNRQQWKAGKLQQAPAVQPQIRPYQGDQLIHSILGTNPATANNPYLYTWFPQYITNDLIIFNQLTTIKSQWSTYNLLIKQGKQNGPTIKAAANSIKKNFNKLPYLAKQWFMQMVDPPIYWDQQNYYIQYQQDEMKKQQEKLDKQQAQMLQHQEQIQQQKEKMSKLQNKLKKTPKPKKQEQQVQQQQQPTQQQSSIYRILAP